MQTITTSDPVVAPESSGWVQSLFATEPRFAGLVARVALGAVMLPHGLQKTAGWFGGYGFKGTMGLFTDTLHIPAVFAFLAILAESLGALLLLAGLATRAAAAAMIVLMAVAMSYHVENGFFMNWFGNQKGEGYEYHLLVIALAGVSVLLGGGAASADGWLAGKPRR